MTYCLDLSLIHFPNIYISSFYTKHGLISCCHYQHAMLKILPPPTFNELAGETGKIGLLILLFLHCQFSDIST